MTTRMLASLAVAAALVGPGLAGGQEQIVTPKDQSLAGSTAVIPSFPPSDRCSSSSPCRNILGEIQRIEESYWIKLPDGNQLHVKASGATRMEDLPKVGDQIAAQITSTGDAEAIVKMPEVPKPMELQVPPKSFQDLRGK